VRDREEGKGKLMREGKENEGMYKLTNTTQEDRPALEKKDKSGGAERRKVVVIIDGARTPEHGPPRSNGARDVRVWGQSCFDLGGHD
jgi:hypothetical protein